MLFLYHSYVFLYNCETKHFLTPIIANQAILKNPNMLNLTHSLNKEKYFSFFSFD